MRPDPSAKATLSSKTLSGKKLPTAMTEQAKAVTERAFHFPTRVGVRKPKDGGAPVGLQLQIAVGYLPSYGTLMVDAQIIPSSEGLVEKKIQCAVHYLKTDGDFRYCVVPEGRKIEPELSGAGESALADWVDKQKWEWAPEGPVRLPSGEEGTAPRLKVHVGDWPTGWHKQSKQQVAERVLELYETRPDSIAEKTWAHKGRLETAREVGREVAPKTHWSGPEGLGSILESGQFQVDGAVFFNPLSPLQADPRIPDDDASTDDRLLAREPIKFNYS